jgi:hypothetical protein
MSIKTLISFSFASVILVTINGCGLLGGAVKHHNDEQPIDAASNAIESAPIVKVDLNGFSYEINRGESLREVMGNIGTILGFSRTLHDFDNSTMDAGNIRSRKSMTLEVDEDSMKALHKELSKIFPEIKNLYLGEAEDGKRKALVISNLDYKEFHKLRVFNVNAGIIEENAKRLAEFYGWKAATPNFWENGVGFHMPVSYAIVSTDIVHAFGRLFKNYPLQARLVDSTNEVVVYGRELSGQTN